VKGLVDAVLEQQMRERDGAMAVVAGAEMPSDIMYERHGEGLQLGKCTVCGGKTRDRSAAGIWKCEVHDYLKEAAMAQECPKGKNHSMTVDKLGRTRCETCKAESRARKAAQREGRSPPKPSKPARPPKKAKQPEQAAPAIGDDLLAMLKDQLAKCVRRAQVLTDCIETLEECG
jgi:hypothetical protein